MLDATTAWVVNHVGDSISIVDVENGVATDTLRVGDEVLTSAVEVFSPAQSAQIVELLQAGDALPPAEPWSEMPNVGEW